MLLWAFLLLAGASEVARASSNGTNSRVKRQFEADRCDPSYCQIPVSDQIIFGSQILLIVCHRFQVLETPTTHLK